MYPLCGAAVSRVYDSASLKRGSCPEETEGDLGGGPSPPSSPGHCLFLVLVFFFVSSSSPRIPGSFFAFSDKSPRRSARKRARPSSHHVSVTDPIFSSTPQYTSRTLVREHAHARTNAFVSFPDFSIRNNRVGGGYRVCQRDSSR